MPFATWINRVIDVTAANAKDAVRDASLIVEGEATWDGWLASQNRQHERRMSLLGPDESGQLPKEPKEPEKAEKK